MSIDFYTAIEKRRTYYAIGKEAITSDERIQEIVEHAVKHLPSAFNSQSTRVCILLDKEHDKLWAMATDILKKVVGPDKDFTPTQQRMDSFKSGYGTVLFFEDQDAVKQLEEKFPIYAENFPLWSEQTSGMHQFAVWTALELEGYGASLQHYNPLIDEAVAKTWDIPSTWKLRAQMPFGKPLAEPNEKTFQPLETRIKVYK